MDVYQTLWSEYNSGTQVCQEDSFPAFICQENGVLEKESARKNTILMGCFFLIPSLCYQVNAADGISIAAPVLD
jgi:hypothetical protein